MLVSEGHVCRSVKFTDHCCDMCCDKAIASSSATIYRLTATGATAGAVALWGGAKSIEPLKLPGNPDKQSSYEL